MNALNNALLAELMEALEAFDARSSRSAPSSSPATSASLPPGRISRRWLTLRRWRCCCTISVSQFDRIRQIKKPVIAAVSGWCLGGGNELALSCDMIVASETARFGQPEINIGVIPGAGGTQRLTRAVGKAIAMEMVLNNRTLSAEEALQFGLVNRVVPVERYLDEALALAAELAGAGSPGGPPGQRSRQPRLRVLPDRWPGR